MATCKTYTATYKHLKFYKFAKKTSAIKHPPGIVAGCAGDCCRVCRGHPPGIVAGCAEEGCRGLLPGTIAGGAWDTSCDLGLSPVALGCLVFRRQLGLLLGAFGLRCHGDCCQGLPPGGDCGQLYKCEHAFRTSAPHVVCDLT